MIVASGKIREKVLMNLRQRILEGRGLPDEWKTNVIVPIFKRKGDVMSCGSYRGVKVLQHSMKIVERILERRIRTRVNLNKIQFGFYARKRNSGCDIHCEECRRNVKRRTRSCMCVLLTWNRLLMEFQEK